MKNVEKNGEGIAASPSVSSNKRLDRIRGLLAAGLSANPSGIDTATAVEPLTDDDAENGGAGEVGEQDLQEGHATSPMPKMSFGVTCPPVCW